MDNSVVVSIFCWGSTTNGELGLGGIEEDSVLKPKLITNFANSSSVQNIACGRYHTLVLLKDGTVYSCGNNDFGQLGRTLSRKKLEQLSSFGSHIAWLAACGENHSVVVTTNGEVFVWGCNSFGQLGLSISDDQVPIPRIIKSLAVSHKIIQVVCGLKHTLVLTESGLIYSWGQNKYGQLGIGKFGGEGEFSPCVVTSLESLPIYQIAAGGHHSLALTRSGSLFAWGKNEFGQLGIGSTDNREYPTLIKTLKQQKVKYICCGEDHTAALTNSGGVFTFGAGMYGQLGHGGTNNEVLPRQVIELMGSVVTQVGCGRCHTLSYIPTRGRIYAFGLGGNGQLGTGTISNWTSPAVVNGPWVHHALDANLKETSWYRPISRLAKQFSEIDVTNNDNIDEPMDWSPHKSINQNSTDFENPLIIHKVVCGGDQSFVISSQRDHLIQPQDFRFLPVDTQICTIETALFEELRNISEDGSISLDYISHIETTFSTAACLNGSFLTKNLEHYGCTSKNCGVDFQLVHHCFSCIRDVKNLTVPELISGCLKDLLPKLPASPPECEALRVYLTLPFCHLFQNPSNTLNIVVELILPLTKCILRLGKTPMLVLELWWNDLEMTYFRNLVAIFTKGIDVLISETQIQRLELAEQMHNILLVLKQLNKVNIDCNEKVPYQEFYIPKITETFDVGEDYLKWLESDDSPRASKFFFCDYPFVFDAQAKTLILQKESQRQMDHAFNSAVQQTVYSLLLPSVIPSEPFLHLNVNRDKIVEDSLTQLMTKSSSDLKKPLKVTFTGEDAVDAGGVRKEFFLLLLREVLDPKYGMFKNYPETNCIWFNDQTFEEAAMFYMIGIICGLAIYNFTIIDLPFPLALYKKLLSEPVKLEDVCGLSPIMAKSLQDLIDYAGDDVESVFCLNFTISVESFGSVKTINLKENGQNINVTKENKKEYVDSYVDYVLNKSIINSFEAFNSGFHKVCANRVLSLFHAQELMALVIGNEDYQWELLQENAEYKNDYHHNHPAIIRFWRVFHSLSTQQKKKFLLFLTGTDRIPILGMKAVKVIIQPMNVDDQHLPVAHTCFNILDLPKYSNESILKEKLLLAIENAQGFGLV